MCGHSLYLPNRDKLIPQFIGNKEIVKKAINFFERVSKINDKLVMGYNSVGAYSSINHLHFQIVDTSQFSDRLMVHTSNKLGREVELEASKVWSMIAELNEK